MDQIKEDLLSRINLTLPHLVNTIHLGKFNLISQDIKSINREKKERFQPKFQLQEQYCSMIIKQTRFKATLNEKPNTKIL